MKRSSMPKLVGRLIYRLLTCLVVLWLAAFYPAVCQYHGLLLFTPPAIRIEQDAAFASGAITVGHKHLPSTDSAHTGPDPTVCTPSAPITEASTPHLRHKTHPLDASPMSLLSVVFLPAIILETAQTHTSRKVAAFSQNHQHQFSPPKPPPRRSVV